MNKRLRTAFLLVWVISCSAEGTKPASAASDDPVPLAKRIAAIQAEAKRIDELGDSPDEGGRRHFAHEIPHWQLSGVFENSKPILVNALFTEGTAVREETYYLRDTTVLLVKVEKWWDLEDRARAPEAPSRQQFYVDKNSVIRRVIQVGTAKAVKRIDDTIKPAEPWAHRAASFTAILLNGTKDPAAMDALKLLREADLPAAGK